MFFSCTVLKGLLARPSRRQMFRSGIITSASRTRSRQAAHRTPDGLPSEHYDALVPSSTQHRDHSRNLDPSQAHYLPPSRMSANTSREHLSGPKVRHSKAGAEPGANPRRLDSIAEYSHIKQECVIDVVDYDAEDILFRTMGNEELVKLMREEPLAENEGDGEDWPPKAVRWINIGGIDWNVLSAIAIRYGLHALALEDILHERGHNHSKADYYSQHLFIRVLCHTLARDDLPDSVQHRKWPGNKPGQSTADEMQDPSDMERGEANGSQISQLTRVDSSTALLSNGKDQNVPVSYTEVPGVSKSKKKQFFSKITGLGMIRDAEAHQHMLRLQAITKGDRVNIKHEPMFIFLLRDGTVISIHPNPERELTDPIAERLDRPESVLRTSEDASLLVESLLDLVVDRIMIMMDEFQAKIHQLEHDILLNPSMDSVRCLHIISGDLIMHKRTLDPIKTMVYNLRQYDIDRCTALATQIRADEASDTEVETLRSTPVGGGKGEKQKPTRQQLRNARKMERRKKEREEEKKKWRITKSQKVEGYISYKSKVYLADVYDHMDFALTSLDMFSGISENLINYAFNVASYEMNKVMNRLTLVTIIFLPLTLLTGYFGMNFTPMWSVDHNSDVLFWKIAIPVMAVLIPIFMFHDIKMAVRHLRQRMAVQNLKKQYTYPNSE